MKHEGFRYGEYRKHPGYISLLMFLRKPVADPGDLAANLFEIIERHTDRQTSHAYITAGSPTKSVRLTRTAAYLRSLRPDDIDDSFTAYCGLTPRDNETSLALRTFWIIEVVQRRSIANSPRTPQILVSVPTYAFRASERSSMAFLHEALELIARRTSYAYGVIECGSPNELHGGYTWASYWMGNLLANSIRYANWQHNTRSRLKRINGLAWGNILGPGMARKLGDREAFMAEFNRRGRDSISRSNIARYDDRFRYDGPDAWRLPKGGLVFTLTTGAIMAARILTLQHGSLMSFEDTDRRIAWLTERLRDADLW